MRVSTTRSPGIRIALIVEGETEQACMPRLRDYLSTVLRDQMPALRAITQHGRVPTGIRLRKLVERLLEPGPGFPFDAVIALTDVYTGTTDFADAADAKRLMREWVGDEPRFYPHVACHDFEAWLLPYWSTIQKLAGHNRGAPPGNPESVNHAKPPSKHIRELFETGRVKKSYSKPRDGSRILQNNDFAIAVRACPELKAFVNAIIVLSSGEAIT